MEEKLRQPWERMVGLGWLAETVGYAGSGVR